MRLRMLAALGVTALTLAAPGSALAGHGHHHKRKHNHAKGKAHHASVRFVHFGATTATETGAGTGTGTGTGTGAGTNTPTTPPSTPENAGTVASYTNGVLTLTLNDNTTASGKVTNRTRIECIKATPPPTTSPPTTTEDQPGDQGPGDDNGQGDDQNRGDMNQQGDHQSGSDEGQGDDNWDGDDDESQGPAEPPCDSSALVTGAIVRAAELRIGPSGSEFESIELVR